MKINIPEVNIPRIVIIGGGFAGLEMAKKLRKEHIQVVLIDKNNYHNFQPLMYQVATGGLEPASIASPLRRIFKGYNNFFFRMAEVLEITPADNCISTSIGSLRYDSLVIATGSKTNYYGMENVEKHSIPMKTIPEALDLRSIILQNFEQAILITDLETRQGLMNFVVVGGGPTGVELAGALGELKRHVLPNDYPELDLRQMQIHLIEAGPKVLGMMSEEASAKTLQFLRDLDVNIWLNCAVQEYDGKTVHFTNNKIRTNALIWTAGVVGDAIKGLPKEVIVRGNRYKVDKYNKVEGTANIYAIGDIASMITEEYPNGHPMVATVAMQQGELLAKNIMNIVKKQPLKPFEYKDKGSMATIGKNKAVVDLKSVKFQGFFAWFVWMIVHLMALVGFRNKLVVFVDWFWNYISFDRALRLIIRPFRRIQVEKKNEVITP